VSLNPYSVDGQDDEIWFKVGQAIGNLQALYRLHISSRSDLDEGDYSDDEDEDEDDNEVVLPVRIPDWELLARILRHILHLERRRSADQRE
jgi:hypothetical protein